MKLILADNLAAVIEKYIEVIEQTKDMNIHARWIYGKHPTDEMIQSFIVRQEMYLFMDEQNVAGMTAITMFQEKNYREVMWNRNLKDDEVASLHIFTVTPEYQGKGASEKMMAEIISLAKEKDKKAIRLDTLASNIPAQRFYEKLGFEYRGKQNLYTENIGYTDFLYYELPLQE